MLKRLFAPLLIPGLAACAGMSAPSPSDIPSAMAMPREPNPAFAGWRADAPASLRGSKSVEIAGCRSIGAEFACPAVFETADGRQLTATVTLIRYPQPRNWVARSIDP